MLFNPHLGWPYYSQQDASLVKSLENHYPNHLEPFKPLQKHSKKTKDHWKPQKNWITQFFDQFFDPPPLGPVAFLALAINGSSGIATEGSERIVRSAVMPSASEGVREATGFRAQKVEIKWMIFLLVDLFIRRMCLGVWFGETRFRYVKTTANSLPQHFHVSFSSSISPVLRCLRLPMKVIFWIRTRPKLLLDNSWKRDVF